MSKFEAVAYIVLIGPFTKHMDIGMKRFYMNAKKRQFTRLIRNDRIYEKIYLKC
jgi:hypothetical protein